MRRGFSTELLGCLAFSGEVEEVGQRRLQKSSVELGENQERAFIRSNKINSESVHWFSPEW